MAARNWIIYLWQREVRMDNSALLSALDGPEPHTPFDISVHDTLPALGSLRKIKGPARDNWRLLVPDESLD